MSFESDTLKSAFTIGYCPVSDCELPYNLLVLHSLLLKNTAVAG